MRFYTVHLRRHGLDPDRDLVLVNEGFCWPAFLFSVVWALWHRLWLVTLITVFALVVLAFAVAVAGPAAAGLALIIGVVANDLRRWTLKRRGFVETGVVAGRDRDAAERRFLEGDPGLAADLRR